LDVTAFSPLLLKMRIGQKEKWGRQSLSLCHGRKKEETESLLPAPSLLRYRDRLVREKIWGTEQVAQAAKQKRRAGWKSLCLIFLVYRGGGKKKREYAVESKRDEKRKGVVYVSNLPNPNSG